jgi:hypothetical protein
LEVYGDGSRLIWNDALFFLDFENEGCYFLIYLRDKNKDVYGKIVQIKPKFI